MVINKDQSNPHTVQIAFDSAVAFQGQVTMTTFGSEQYVWHSDGAHGHPDPDEPPVTKTISANQPVVLPKASITVLRARA